MIACNEGKKSYPMPSVFVGQGNRFSKPHRIDLAIWLRSGHYAAHARQQLAYVLVLTK
jgi:hypothetical protein